MSDAKFSFIHQIWKYNETNITYSFCFMFEIQKKTFEKPTFENQIHKQFSFTEITAVFYALHQRQFSFRMVYNIKFYKNSIYRIAGIFYQKVSLMYWIQDIIILFRSETLYF